MITEDRLHHILAVSRKMYDNGKEYNLDEKTCRQLFLCGWLHDIGYEFGDNTSHPEVGCSILEEFIGSSSNIIEAISHHGIEVSDTLFSYLLNLSDMSIDGKGNCVTIEERLKDIGNRYGEESEVYIRAKKICEEIKVVGNKF